MTPFPLPALCRPASPRSPAAPCPARRPCQPAPPPAAPTTRGPRRKGATPPTRRGATNPANKFSKIKKSKMMYAVFVIQIGGRCKTNSQKFGLSLG